MTSSDLQILFNLSNINIYIFINFFKFSNLSLISESLKFLNFQNLNLQIPFLRSFCKFHTVQINA